MKKFILFLITFLFMLFMCNFVYAVDAVPDVFINGEKQNLNGFVLFENSTVYVETHKMAEIFKATLSADNENVVFTFSNNVRNVTYDSNNGSVIVGDRNSFLNKIVEDAYPSIVRGEKVYVPIRMICFGFYMNVTYNQSRHAVFINQMYDGVGIFNSEGVAVTVSNGKYALVNSAGGLLCGFDYDSISNYDNDTLFVVSIKDSRGLVNSKGNIIVDVIYDDIIYESSSKIYLIKDGMKGLCDIDGKIHIRPVFEDIVYCGNSIAMVKQSDGWHTFNFAKGDYSDKIYDEVYKITTGVQSDNDMIEGYYVILRNKWGCIDSFGNTVIDTKYEALDKFDIYGRARMIYNGKMGIVDCGGKIIIPAAYDYIHPYGRLNSTVAMVGGKYGILDSKGDVLVGFDYDYIYHFNDQISTVAYKNDKFGIISNQGKIISDFEYKYMENFKNGIALTYKDGYGYVDHMGHEIIPAVYEDVKQGTALSVFLKKDGLWELLSPRGEVLSEYKFLSAGEFSNGLSAVSLSTPNGEKYGYVNDSGDVIIPFEYDNALNFKYGKAIVNKGKYCGIIDVEGNVVIPFEYTGFNPSYDYNVTAAADESGKWGLVSLNNEKLTDFEYDYIFEFENGFAPVLLNHKYGLINAYGKVVVDLKHNSKEDVLKFAK